MEAKWILLVMAVLGSLTTGGARSTRKGSLKGFGKSLELHKSSLDHFSNIQHVQRDEGLQADLVTKKAYRKGECRHLEKAMLKFSRSSKNHNPLLDVMGMEAKVNRHALTWLGEVLHRDIHSSKDISQLADILCKSRSRAYLAYSLRVDISEVDNFFDTYINPVKSYGRITSLKKVAKLTVELLEWTLRTGYPVAPLRHVDRNSTQTFLQHIQAEMTSDPRVRRALRDEHFPLAYDPAYAAIALTEARSLSDLANMLQVPEVWLRAFARKMKPRRIAKSIRSVRATVRLFKIADKMGLLNIQ